jgi:hypothetical protein
MADVIDFREKSGKLTLGAGLMDRILKKPLLDSSLAREC